MRPEAVALSHGPPDELGVLESGAADQKKGRNGPVTGQDVEDRRGELGVRTVVEGYGDRPLTRREAPIDPADALSEKTSTMSIAAAHALQHVGMVVPVEKEVNAL